MRTEDGTSDLRWCLLDGVPAARAHWGLTDRSLQVLRALLAFLPRGERVHMVVFPSNRTLCDRLMGMPESTLRRHLSRLVDAGLIARRDSANRKRFRVGRCAELSFGFDLAPLFAAAQTIRAAAEAAQAERLRIAELRARLRLAAAALHPEDPRAVGVLRLVRRKVPSELLESALKDLPAPEMIATDSEIERHRQTEYRTQTPAPDETVATTAMEEVAEIVGPDSAATHDMDTVAHRAALAIGIEDAWKVARHRNGQAWALLVLAYLHRRLSALRSPGPYLLTLCQRARDGEFDILQALRSTALMPGGVSCRPATQATMTAGQGACAG